MYRTLNRSYKQRSIVIPTADHQAHNLLKWKAQSAFDLSPTSTNKSEGRAGMSLVSGWAPSGNFSIK